MKRPQFIRKKQSKPEIPALFKKSETQIQPNNKRYVEDDIVMESDADRDVSDLEESIKMKSNNKKEDSHVEDMNMLESVDSMKFAKKTNNFMDESEKSNHLNSSRIFTRNRGNTKFE